VWRLLWQLRDLFGRPQVLAEDLIRTRSLRAAAHFSAGSPGSSVSTAFLASVEPEVILDFTKNPEDRRAFELVNKTNQFNLNGDRFTESGWAASLQQPSSFLLTVSYQDRFGPLGRIGVVLGCWGARRCSIDAWVLSCRAFSRLIEHQTLQRLFRLTGADEIEFAYRATPRNGPLREFFASILGADLSGERLLLSRSRFEEVCPELPHQTKEILVASDRPAPAEMLSGSVPRP
jgi:FkbH-like protein